MWWKDHFHSFCLSVWAGMYKCCMNINKCLFTIMFSWAANLPVSRKDYEISHRLSPIRSLACSVANHLFILMYGEANEEQISDITHRISPHQ